MDAGIAAIVAAAVSTVVGGTVGFLSAFLTAREAARTARQQATLPRQTQALDFVSRAVFKCLAGENLSEDDWNHYISACFWLPATLRKDCIGVLSDKENIDVLRKAQRGLIERYDALTGGC